MEWDDWEFKRWVELLVEGVYSKVVVQDLGYKASNRLDWTVYLLGV